jgi:hypothetical protein
MSREVAAATPLLRTTSTVLVRSRSRVDRWFIRLYDSGVAVLTVEVLQYAAIVMLCLVPAALAVLARRERPILYVAAAALLFGVSPVLWSAMPLALAAGIALLWAYVRSSSRRPRAGRLLSVVVPVALVLLSVAVIGRTRTNRCAFDGDEFVCRDVAPIAALAGSTVLAAAAAGAGWALAAPRSAK